MSGKIMPDFIGNKALSLYFLKKNHFSIPQTWILHSKAFEEYHKHDKELFVRLKEELELLPDESYAVRSSTSIEDSLESSHAGQFQTVLNVSGKENILNAIRDVWESVSVLDVNESPSFHNQGVKCAVILQKMVPAVLSGVSFSKNPVNSHHEIVIEAIEGHGEDLVQKGLTPIRWRIKKDIIVEGDRDSIFIPTIKKVTDQTIAIRKLYGSHVDIEWAFDGSEIYYLQVRPLTGKNEIPVYSSKMAKEMLPGQIKPLVWSVNIPLVNGTWLDIISKITGQVNVRPEELAKPFYYRTYFDIAALGRLFSQFGISVESLEYLLTSDEKKHPSFRPGFKILKHSFRIIWFIKTFLWFENFFLKEYPTLQKIFNDIEWKIRDSFTLETYPDLYREIFLQSKRLVYLNIMVPILMQIHSSRLRKKLKKAGIEHETLDFYNDFPELESLSPIHSVMRIKALIEDLPEYKKTGLIEYNDLSNFADGRPVIDALEEFVRKFGHFSESGNDFSYKKWEESPEIVFSMVLNTPSSFKEKNLVSFKSLQKERKVNHKIAKLYRKAGKYMVYREKISSLYTFGYGQFRKLFNCVAQELVSKGIIKDRDDIFYLNRMEIDKALSLADTEEWLRLQKLIRERKNEMEATKDYTLPVVIYGDVAPILENSNQKNYTGVGSSAGVFRGKARIIRKLDDFKPEDRGAVLIIPFSDVSWSPVLLQAGAIVSEAGGMLSHCSILARESGIPSLVSVDNACAIPDGSEVTVDGSNGILTLHDNGKLI